MSVLSLAPKIYENNDTMQAIYSVQQDELSNLLSEIRISMKDTFVYSLTSLNGIRQWENILGITPNASYTMEQRRENVVNKLFYRPPFTAQRFREILVSLWGEGDFFFIITPATYLVLIDVRATDPTTYYPLMQNVREIIPSNMRLIFSIPYTFMFLERRYTWGMMENHTWGDLSRYAHILGSSTGGIEL